MSQDEFATLLIEFFLEKSSYFMPDFVDERLLEKSSYLKLRRVCDFVDESLLGIYTYLMQRRVYDFIDEILLGKS